MSDDNDGLDDFDKTLASLGAVPPKETPPWTVVPSKPYGDAELAADMAIMLNGRLTVTDAMGLIRQYGPLKAQLAAKRLAKGDFASIENLPMALRSAIESGHQVPGEQKTAPRTQNQANSSSNGQSSNTPGSHHPSAAESQSSEIDKLRKGCMWNVAENREWYLGLPMAIRAIVVSDALHKWPSLEQYADKEGYDMRTNDFAHSDMFRIHFSRVINAIRFDNVSRGLRSQIDRGDAGEIE